MREFAARQLHWWVLLLFPIAAYPQPDLPQLVRKVLPAVVTIRTQGPEGAGIGSGFVVTPDGKVASSLHVLGQATRAQVALANGDLYEEVSILGFDARRDLVILKIPAFGLPILPLGDSNRVEVGQQIVAVGASRGLEGTVTNGIVSALRDHPDGYKILQVTAPVNPGNSGGPLVNQRGEVVGVVVAKLRGAENLNFVVPINYLRGLLGEPERRMSLSELRAALSPPHLSVPRTDEDPVVLCKTTGAIPGAMTRSQCQRAGGIELPRTPTGSGSSSVSGSNVPRASDLSNESAVVCRFPNAPPSMISSARACGMLGGEVAPNAPIR